MSAIEITWLGHSCFLIKGKDATIVTDPYDDSIGYSLGNPTADVVTTSHPHPGHGFTSGVDAVRKVVRGPGEYEVSGVLITGLATFHDAEEGRERGKNTAYLIEIDEMTLCHLGDLGHSLSSAQVEEMSGVDVLLVPVGGVSTIDAAVAAETVRQLQPKVVIPMHYQTPVLRFRLEPVDGFLKEMGTKADLAPQSRLSATKTNLPEETQLVLLDYRS